MLLVFIYKNTLNEKQYLSLIKAQMKGKLYSLPNISIFITLKNMSFEGGRPFYATADFMKKVPSVYTHSTYIYVYNTYRLIVKHYKCTNNQFFYIRI